MSEIKQALSDYIATSNSGKYSDTETLMSKFPELNGYDVNLLDDYVATANSGKYKDEDELNSKFPEFFVEDKKKKLKSKPSSQKKQSVLDSKKTGSSTSLATGPQGVMSGSAFSSGKFSVGSSGYIGEVKPFANKTIVKPTQEQTDLYLEKEIEKLKNSSNKIEK